MLHSLTRKGSNGRDALAHNNAVLERDRVSALPADIDCDRFQRLCDLRIAVQDVQVGICYIGQVLRGRALALR